jgi:hypothetical protein
MLIERSLFHILHPAFFGVGEPTFLFFFLHARTMGCLPRLDGFTLGRQAKPWTFSAERSREEHTIFEFHGWVCRLAVLYQYFEKLNQLWRLQVY